MNRFLFVALAAYVSILFPVQSVDAKTVAAKERSLALRENSHYYQMLERLRSNFAVKQAPMLRFIPSPSDEPEAGQDFSVFIQPESNYANANILLDAKLNGSPVGLVRSSETLWALYAGSFSEVRNHELTISISLEDKNIAGEIRRAIERISAEIDHLNRRIAVESDPLKRSTLIAQKNEKTSIRNRLVDELTELKKPIAEQKFSFKVKPAVGDSRFPRITGISPNVGPLSGGTTITISGENFSSGASVKLQGAAATNITFINENTISAVTPAFPGGDGPKDVELRLPPLLGGSEDRNAFFYSGFFATSSSVDQVNVRPVAVTSGHQTIALGASVTLDGNNSFDPNQHQIVYSWRILASPEGSLYLPNQTLDPVSAPTFLPDVPGHYVIELTVKESSTPELLESEPSLATVQVNGLTNSAPIPTATPIVIKKNTSGVAVIVPNDIDVDQSHAYSIVSGPSHGEANLEGEEVSYSPNPDFVGSDSFVVRVTDNGAPALFGDIIVPVSVLESVITINDIYYEITSKDGLISVGMDPILGPPSGAPIVSAEWDFGDGTGQRSDAPSGFVNHDFVAFGTYTVTVKLTDAAGAVATRSKSITLDNTDIPVARLSADVLSGPAPLTVNFDASASTDNEGIVAYSWRWGDGSPQQTFPGPTASKTFNQPGNYQVRLRVRDGAGNINFTFVDIHVGTNPHPGGSRPWAQMNLGSRQVVLGNPHNFSALNSFDPNPNGFISAYNWNFGDWYSCGRNDPVPGCGGSNSTESHSYQEAGSYWAALSVEGALGRVSQQVGREILAVNSGNAPRAVIHRKGLDGVAPYTVILDGSDSFDYDGSIQSYFWSVDCDNEDGVCESINPAMTHTFNEDGAYFVGFEVTDNDNNRHSAFATVFVYPNESVRKKTQSKVKMLSSEFDPEREGRRRFLTGACAKGHGASCYGLAKLYEEDGNDFAAEKLFEKACTLGYQDACSVAVSR